MLVGIIIAILILGIVGFIGYGNVSWSRKSNEFTTRLHEDAAGPAVYNEEEIADLPAPVQRYFRNALTDGQPIIRGLFAHQSGTFNMGQDEDQWKPFTAEQTVRTGHPGFLWDARIRMLPILPVHVHDAYIDGAGYLHGALFGAVTVMEMSNTRELAHGEFLRFLGETAWYPTALLPSQGADWEAVDNSSARVTLTDPGAEGGALSATMLFRFNEENLIESVYAEERGAEVNGEMVPTPWEGRWWSYEERDGMLVPTEGEVAWLFPDRRKPYWRGRMDELNYEFAERQ